jgi:hypothetical protein
LTALNEAAGGVAYGARMPIATAPPAASTALALLRARAWVVPWVLLAAVVGFSIAGAQRGSALPRAEEALSAEGKAQAARAAVRCEVRHGFALRLAITAQMMARSFASGARQGEHVPGATCQVQGP